MTRIYVKVSRAGCIAKADGFLTAGMVGLPVSFEFGSEWSGLAKTAVFRAGTVTRDRIDIGNDTTVPAEVMEKPREYLHVGVYGYREDGTIVIPTVEAMVGMILRGADPSSDPGTDPELPVWAELKQDIEDLKKGGTGGGITATTDGDAIVITTSLPVRTEGDAIVIGGA